VSSTVNEQPCPSCGQPVLVTATTLEHGDQLALDRTECPHCAAHLVRDVDGHVDGGWRLAEEPDD
jgi:ribosomal protein S27AE